MTIQLSKQEVDIHCSSHMFYLKLSEEELKQDYFSFCIEQKPSMYIAKN